MHGIDPGAAVDLGALNQDLAVAALVVHLVVGLRGGGALFDQALDAAAAAVIAVLDGFGTGADLGQAVVHRPAVVSGIGG